MNIAKITVHIRSQQKVPNVKAFADVVLDFGEDGSIELAGFSIVQDQQRPAWVVPPANKGKRIYFNVVLLKGKIQRTVNAAVLEQYHATMAKSKTQDGRP
jgi:hypothetical protein